MTAVEWLFEQVVNRTERVYFLKELEQAKEMFKKQIIDTYNKGHESGIGDYIDNEWGSDMTELTAEQYYNETFKIMDERDYIAMNKELKTNSMNSAVELLLDWLGENYYYIGNDLLEKIDELKEIEANLAEQYAEYRIIFDRHGMNPIKFKDWLKQYN